MAAVYAKLTAEPLLLGLDYIAELTDEQIMQILCRPKSANKPKDPKSDAAKGEFIRTAMAFGASFEKAVALYEAQIKEK